MSLVSQTFKCDWPGCNNGLVILNNNILDFRMYDWSWGMFGEGGKNLCSIHKDKDIKEFVEAQNKETIEKKAIQALLIKE